jgi:monofunctional biosynthetic peptidoglycan transglycosylase
MKNKSSKWGARFVLALCAGLIGLAGVITWGVYDFMCTEFPDVGTLKNHFPIVKYHGTKEPATIVISKARPSGWVTLGEISKVAVGAIVVSEDWAFYQHKGYDAKQIKEAIKEDWEEGRFARGASTITQQVVRNVYLDKDKNLWRKAKEFYLAIRIEQRTGKKKILETYLNIAEWGEGVFGINAASRKYFDKAPAQLTAREGAFLAMLLPSPKRYGQSFRAKKLTEYAHRTVEDILDKMVRARYLTEEERAAMRGELLSFEIPAAPVLPEGAEEKDGAEGPAEPVPGEAPPVEGSI